MSDFKLNSTNWQDGMLLTMGHLRDQDRYFEELVRWHATGADDNYGLVKKRKDQPSLILNSTLSSNRLIVEVKRCQALLPCGAFIEFNETLSGGGVLRAEIEAGDPIVRVYIGADTADKKQVGDPDPSEEVPRVPYELPNYIVALKDPPNLPEDRYMQIAELAVQGSEVSQVEGYFPPCLRINADERLSSAAINYRNRVENLLKLSINAFLSASSDKSLEGASTRLQSAFRETTYYLVYHMSSHLDDFIVGRNAPHPGRMIVQFKKLFRVVSSLFNLQPALKDYLNEKFFTRETGSDIGAYLSSVDSFLLSEYNHRDIASQIRMIDGILDILRALMAFLSKTSLDQLSEQAVATETLMYRGKTYNNTSLKSSKLEQVGELSYLVMEFTKPTPVDDALTLINKDIFSDSEWRSMQVRLGLNNARGLGETDPVDVDINSYSNKVVLHPLDMLQSSSVNQVTLVFRGMSDSQKLGSLGKTDLILYIV
ncbi:MAG: hypothetical protein JW746_01455 [Candidatus Krumholzibacteriota bacterium]|nr:hypothetical protein [Candidatus Krumholzibacteriota bacterium]